MSRLWPALHSVDEIKVLTSSFIEYRVDAYNSGYGFEVLSIYWFTICLGKVKETTGTEMYLWFTGFLIATFISMLLLVKATQNLPIGTAYAVWTGIGAVGTVLVGILVFREPASFWRLFFIVMLISSIIGLKMVSH